MDFVWEWTDFNFNQNFHIQPEDFVYIQWILTFRQIQQIFTSYKFYTSEGEVLTWLDIYLLQW